MQSTNFLIAICIPTYNRKRDLEKCLQSVCSEIEKYHLQNLASVIISDNNSTDGTAEVAQKYIKQYKTISIVYSKNELNVGAVNNFIKLVEISNATYTYILGDDDVLGQDALQETIQLIQANLDVLVFHLKCQQTDFIPKGLQPTRLNVYQAARQYFYNIGNAGTFIFKTTPAQAFLSQHKTRVAGTCWPQTDIMFWILMQQKHQQVFIASGIELVISDSHDANVFYNTWYIAETFCFSQLRIVQNIYNDYKDVKFVRNARKAIPACQTPVKFFFRFVLFATYYDYPYELQKTLSLILENKRTLKGFNYLYPLIYSILYHLPSVFKKLATFFYFFISKPSFKKSTFIEQYAAVKAYQQAKYLMFKEKGKLTAETERYIY